MTKYFFTFFKTFFLCHFLNGVSRSCRILIFFLYDTYMIKTDEESLMLTWFNIVGYCLRKGLLSGGSPALAKTFYPKCQEDDYKAIIKGKNGDNATFKALEPLLDKYIK